MPRIRIQFLLPYALDLSDGDYHADHSGYVLILTLPPVANGMAKTLVASDLSLMHPVESDDRDQEMVEQADRLLTRVNRLLRWYRAVSRDPEVKELTRAQASPFEFVTLDADGLPTPEAHTLSFQEYEILKVPVEADEVIRRVRAGLISGFDPRVEELFLLDAHLAMLQGRFREAVLFSWSTIDTVFNRTYDAMIDNKLAGEWKEAVKSRKEFDLGLRTKMTAVLKLLCGKSLRDEPNDYWTNLSNSYKKRNGIIHAGETADEDDARIAIQVASRTVLVMRNLSKPRPEQPEQP
jgi:hypothetical protein